MKKCKPNFRMNHFEGCGEEKPIFKYGSCQKCFIKWTQETEEGGAWLKKMTIQKVKKDKAEKSRLANVEKKRQRIEMMSNVEYWSKILQPNINLVARLIDQGNPCIATEKFGKMNGGHYISVGANRTTSLNLHNIHIQSFQSNHFQSGDIIKYQAGLQRVYGEDYYQFVESLRRTPSLNITKIEMKEYNSIARKAISILRDDFNKDLIRSPAQRIKMRNMINEELGIYDKEFTTFGV